MKKITKIVGIILISTLAFSIFALAGPLEDELICIDEYCVTCDWDHTVFEDAKEESPFHHYCPDQMPPSHCVFPSTWLRNATHHWRICTRCPNRQQAYHAWMWDTGTMRQTCRMCGFSIQTF